MIKLLAVDMDETAVNSRHRMTKVTKEALREVYAKGIHVVPVTGRCLEGLPANMRGMDVMTIPKCRRFIESWHITEILKCVRQSKICVGL